MPDPGDPIFAAQVRAARALLQWSQGDLAARSGVSPAVIARLERCATDARSSTIRAIKAAFEAAGINFTSGRDGSFGISRRFVISK